MGAEATATIAYKGKTHKGTARLETSLLQVRAAGLTLDLPFATMTSVVARDGTLSIASPVGAVTLALGAASAKWAEKIRHPPSRLSKIGVKPQWRVSVVGPLEKAFLAELKSVASNVAVGRVLEDSDAIFLVVTDLGDLDRIVALKASLRPAGALWVVRPKGHKTITEGRVMAAARAAGLVDVKVVAFSSTHSAGKFVIPVANRR